MIGRNVKEIDFFHSSGTSLILYFLYFIHSSFLLNICIQKIIHHFCSLYINHFQSYLSEEQKRILPKNLIEKRQALGLKKHLFMDGHYFFSKKSPSNIDPCQYSTTHLSPFFLLSRCPSEN